MANGKPKKSYYRRRTFRSNRRGRPRTTRMLTNVGTHFFKRTVVANTITPSVTNGQFEIKFSDIPGYTDFTNLFDQYMITKVVYTFRPDQNQSTVLNASNIPTVRCAEDMDGGGAQTWVSMGEMKHKDLYLNKPRKFVQNRPSVQTEVYRGITTTAYAPRDKVWLDMGVTDVPHYSMKWATYALPSVNYNAPIDVTIYFKCRGVR